MDGDHARWANPIRAQKVVEALEKRLGIDADAPASDSAERLDSATESREAPD